MTINDPIFGELKYENGWTKEMKLYFLETKLRYR